ncbi:hypothetical protein IVA79_04320 [Bradyrhizobium sp. 138]|uniref:hypothetical protein n=1 Tax=Bradyrhizobium sp. 138 TaxID=2782615 RepID=UPI001FF71EA1|nr:hypothetical protein [Bradyrhizobium sp. 138]MCK1733201.1 hypothetical protein [Bradyrhizobium sp. 138]
MLVAIAFATKMARTIWAMANRKVDYPEPSAGSDGIMTNAARKSLMLVKGASRRRP